MADIRIKDLATTAASTASDDFIAVDGSANGTRKLNAYSPTFGGNLTVSGTGASTVNGNLLITGTTNYTRIRRDDTIIDFTNAAQSAYADAQIIASTLYLKGNNGTGLTIGTTGSATLAGNLTVSGTGTSAIQGDTINLGAVGNVATVVNLFRNNASVGGMYAGNSDFNLFGGASAASHLVIKSNGNVLIGTTVDSSALLQVGTNTTTAAGGMKFGTDTSLYRSAAGQLRGPSSFIDATFASSGLFFGASMTLQANDNVLIKTNGSVTALTLDTSQNATFAGDVGLSGNEKYLNLFSTYVVGSNSRARLRAVGSGGGSGYGGSFTVDTRTSGNTFITALTIDDAQNATFAGSIAIGNTVNTVSPTSPNRTITMVIGGTTYYIHAKTTND